MAATQKALADVAARAARIGYYDMVRVRASSLDWSVEVRRKPGRYWTTVDTFADQGAARRWAAEWRLTREYRVERALARDWRSTRPAGPQEA